MEDTVIVIMLKDKDTGFLEKELLSCKIVEHENLIVNIFAEEDGDDMSTHIKITTDRDTEDWEFAAIYDYYDTEVLKDCCSSVLEVEDCFNPTWEVILPFLDDTEEMENRIAKILHSHKQELHDVYEAIKDKKMEYTE